MKHFLQNMNITTVLYETKIAISAHKINKLLHFKQQRKT